ncbi:MAG: hypothetical protein LBJ70_00120 [Holosporales bacterium]|nr:hypothetical protein [Holosporales bacterium]
MQELLRQKYPEKWKSSQKEFWEQHQLLRDDPEEFRKWQCADDQALSVWLEQQDTANRVP